MVVMAKGSVFGGVKTGALALLLAFAMFAVSIFATVTITAPGQILFNWTNFGGVNITVSSSPSNVVYVHHEMTGISGNYSQRGEYPYGGAYNKYWWQGAIPGCFSSLLAIQDNPVAVRNGTGQYSNLNNVSISNTITIIHNVTCPPGRYWGYLRVSNSSNQSNLDDHDNITVTINVPISTANVLSNSTGEGEFKGKFPVNKTGYHYFYFNTSNITNATGIEVTLTDLNQDIDIFLFDDSGNLMAKSINKGSSSESLTYKYLPAGKMWEIRIYGNVTSADSYTGTAKFTTLNATNATSGGQLNSIAFGSMGIGSNRTVYIRLKNEGSLTPSVSDSFELYHVKYFSGSGANNFSFVVPGFATKVSASVNWTGSNNNTITLYKPDNTIVGNSSTKNTNARGASAGMYEEFVETASITGGTWKAGVVSTGGSYSGELRFWVPANSSWLNTNFSDGILATNQSFYVNLSVPGWAMSGMNRGKMKYIGSVLEIPFSINVTSPTLVVDSNISSGQITVTDNIGINRSGSNPRITLRLNNTGNQNMNIENCPNSSMRLVRGTSSDRINFTFSCPTGTIGAGSSSTVDIDFIVNTEETNNNPGIYTGWIFFNDTESHPYQGFNLTLNVDLTQNMIVQLSDFASGNAIDTSADKDVTIFFYIKYANDSSTEVLPYLHFDNVSVWLMQENTSHRIPPSGYLTKHNVTVDMWEGDRYKLNVTVPSGNPGGSYKMYLSAATMENGATLTGTGTKYPLFLNTDGIKMTAIDNTNLGAVDERRSDDSEDKYFNMTVVNYGPKHATNQIRAMNVDTDIISVSIDSHNCPTTGSTSTSLTLNLPGNGTQVCYVRWKIRPDDDVSRNETESFDIVYDGSDYGGLHLSILVEDTEETPSPAGGGPAGAFCDDDDDCAWNTYCENGACRALTCSNEQYISNHRCVLYRQVVEIIDYKQNFDILVGSNESSTVMVKNVGNRSLSASLGVDINDDITATVSPGWCSLQKERNCTFNMNLIVSEDAVIGEHTGTLKAYVKDNESSFFTQIFKVKVLPDEEKKREINTTYDGYELLFMALEREFNNIKAMGFVSEISLSKAELLLNQTKVTLADAKLAIIGEDYVEADSLVRGLNSTIDRIEREIELLNEERAQALELKPEDLYLWIIIGVIIAGALGLVAYMFMPTGGYRAGYGYRPAKRVLGRNASATDKIKAVFEEIADRIKRFFSRFKRKKSVGEDIFRYKFKK